MAGSCVESNCDFLLTYRGNGDFIDFEMSAKANGYVAVGFSYDEKMVNQSRVEDRNYRKKWDFQNSKKSRLSWMD